MNPSSAPVTVSQIKSDRKFLPVNLLYLLLGVAIAFTAIYLLKPSLITKEIVKEVQVTQKVTKKADKRNDTWLIKSKIDIRNIVRTYPFINSSGNIITLMLYESNDEQPKTELILPLYKFALKDETQNLYKKLERDNSYLFMNAEVTSEDEESLTVDISENSNYIFMGDRGAGAEGPSDIYIYDQDGNVLSQSDFGNTLSQFIIDNRPESFGMFGVHNKGWKDGNTYSFVATDGDNEMKIELTVPSMVLKVVK